MAYPQLNQDRYQSLKRFALQTASAQPAPLASNLDTEIAPTQRPKHHLHFGHHHRARHYGAVQNTHKSNDIKNDLRTELNAAKGSPENTLKALDKSLVAAKNDLPMQKELVGVALAVATNSDKAYLIASKPEFMKDKPAAEKDLSGHNLSQVPKEKIPALVADPGVNLNNTIWPADVDVSHLRIDRKIEGVKAPGLVSYGATGSGSIQGDVSGGAINNSHSELAMHNAQANAQWGSTIDKRFALTDTAGNSVALAEAAQEGPSGVQRAMTSRHFSAKLPGMSLMSGPSFG